MISPAADLVIPGLMIPLATGLMTALAAGRRRANTARVTLGP
jgi:hypothetical protein